LKISKEDCEGVGGEEYGGQCRRKSFQKCVSKGKKNPRQKWEHLVETERDQKERAERYAKDRLQKTKSRTKGKAQIPKKLRSLREHLEIYLGEQEGTQWVGSVDTEITNVDEGKRTLQRTRGTKARPIIKRKETTPLGEERSFNLTRSSI